LPLRLEERPRTRAFWRSHFEVWELSGLTQREYCERHGLSLKNFGNWRGQLKREDAVGVKARWGRYPRLRPSSGPSSDRPKIERPKTERPTIEKPAPAVVMEPGGQRRFSEDAKRRIVEETYQPGVSVSRVARQYGITTSLLFRWRRALGIEPKTEAATFLPVQIADDGMSVTERREASDQPTAPSMIATEALRRIAEIYAVEKRVRGQSAKDRKRVRQIESRPLVAAMKVVEMELWDTADLDMLEPAYIAFDGKGSGEFLFGCVTAELDCADTPAGADFTWQDHDEMDEASGDGFAELEDNGTLTGEIRFHRGDESTFRARPW
jgi:transposase-like protein